MEGVITGRVAIARPQGLPELKSLIVPKPGEFYMANFDYAEAEERYLKTLREIAIAEHKERIKNSAVEKGLVECQNCGVCCKNAPCKLKPGQKDIKRLAKVFGLTSEDFFKKYLTVDRHYENYSSAYYLTPIRKGQEDLAGKFIPDERTHTDEGSCIFLEEVEGKSFCKIQENKPSQGAAYKCWSKSKVPTSAYAWEKEQLLALGWDGIEDSEEEDYEE